MGRVSYSQYAMWATCPHKWKLSYIDDLKVFTESIHMLFGTAVHHILQEYLTVMYADTAVAADALDMPEMLRKKMGELYLESKKSDNFIEYTSKEQMLEFYNDGLEIINYFKRHRGDYFSKKGYSLVGVEVPIDIKLGETMNFVGYLDVVIKDDLSGDIYIYDFKTSTMGWRDTVKKDEAKTAQLILYKKFYAQQYNIPIDQIHVEFIILKRKLMEYSDFPQKRFQRVEPASGKVTVKKITQNFQAFMDDCFDGDGNYILKEYTKLPSPKACKYCEFAKDKALCDKNKPSKKVL